jgi:hypothetical protein
MEDDYGHPNIPIQMVSLTDSSAQIFPCAIFWLRLDESGFPT